MLRSILCDYKDTYIITEGTIIVTDPNDANYDKKLAFTNNAPFILCISKFNNRLYWQWRRHSNAYAKFDWMQ